jgi:hypothetical protein
MNAGLESLIVLDEDLQELFNYLNGNNATDVLALQHLSPVPSVCLGLIKATLYFL